MTAHNACLGTMFFGTTVDPSTSFAILDRYAEAGGTLLDTANNYAAWIDGASGDESETLLGDWLDARGNRDEMQIASKIGARPVRPGSADVEGLSPSAVREQVQGSLRRLRVDRLDLLYAHIDDRTVPLAETLGAFDALVTEGVVGAVGASNYTAARLREAHAVSDANGWAPYTALQSRATYLTSRPDADFGRWQIELDDDLAAYAATRQMRVFGYSTLLAGLYARPETAVPDPYRHDGTDAQLAAVRTTAERLGCRPSQVVYAWSSGHGVTPVFGVSTVAQLDEALAAGPELLDEQAHRDLAKAREG